MNSIAFPFLLLILADAMNGSFTLPMKFTRIWASENTWLAWTVAALFQLSVTLTMLTVPALGDVNAESEGGTFVLAASFGGGRSFLQVFFGLAVESIGIALTLSVVLGLSAAVGCLIPLRRLDPEAVLQRGGLAALLGIALVLAGVAWAAAAQVRITPPEGVSQALTVNLMENGETPLEMKDGQVIVPTHPYEIQTVGLRFGPPAATSERR